VHAFSQGASAVVLGFTAFELLFGVLQWWRVAGQGRPAQAHASIRA
jgi:hypothetical protein